MKLTTFNNDLAAFIIDCSEKYPWLPKALCERYTRAYGTRITLMIDDTHSLEDLGFYFGHGLYAKEVDYLMRYEWALTADDILWRRSKLGIYFSNPEIELLKKYMS